MKTKSDQIICSFKYCILIFFSLLFIISCIREREIITSPAGNRLTDETIDKLPDEMELERFLTETETNIYFKSNPLFASEEKTGVIPPVTSRLPDEPLIVKPEKEAGKYGGKLQGASIGLEEGTVEIITWKQTNLFKFSKDLKSVVPHAGKGWKWENDYKKLTIFLRKGHKWSDGAPFTADDIIFWWNDIILNNEITKEIPFQWLRNGKPVYFNKVSDTEFTITSDFPIPDLVYLLTDVRCRPFAPKHYLEKFHIKYNADADKNAKASNFSNWAERFRSIFDVIWEDAINNPAMPSLNSHVLIAEPDNKGRIFKANPYYFAADIYGNQLPYINYIEETFAGNLSKVRKMITSGKIDLKSQYLNIIDYDFYKKYSDHSDYSISVFQGGSTRTLMFSFNATHPDPVKRKIFSDVRFRKAMSIAINREEISEYAYMGNAVIQQALPTMEASFVGPEISQLYTEYNPDMAVKLLEEIGLKKDSYGKWLLPDNRSFVINYGYTLESGAEIVHKLLTRYWRDIGFEVRTTVYSLENERKRLWKNTQDLAVWKAEEFWEISMIRNLDFYLPPFNDTNPMVGIPWKKWYTSSGREGIKPPDDILKLYDLVEEAKITIPGTGEYTKIRTEIVSILAENLWITGTAGHSLRIMIISNKIGNMPANIETTEYSYLIPYRPYQWFINKQE